jgi:hypothetical protein
MTCQEQWTQHRKLHWQAVLALPVGIFLSIVPTELATFIYRTTGYSLPALVFYIVSALCAITAFSLLIISSNRLRKWPCPQCGMPFFAWHRGPLPFLRKMGSNSVSAQVQQLRTGKVEMFPRNAIALSAKARGHHSLV